MSKGNLSNGSMKLNNGNGGTGGTGGMGSTGHTGAPGDTGLPDYVLGFGGTGASGLGGEVGKAVSSIMDMDESIGNFAKKLAWAGLLGATGGEGQIGSLDEAIKDDDSLSDLSKKFTAQINDAKDSEALLKDFNECQTTLELVLNKTNAVNAYFAFVQGKRLLKLQGLRSQEGGNSTWIKWIGKKLPNLKKRSREKYMSLAAIPFVENHFEYGVERLAEFGVLFSSKSEEEREQLGSDPIKKYMENFEGDTDSSYDERRSYLDAVLEVGKLNRAGVEFSLDVMISFLRVEDPLTGEERKHLKRLYENDPQEPVELLNRIIAKKLMRKNLIAGTDILPSSDTPAENNQGVAADANPDAPLTGPNIDRLVVSLCKSLEPVATKSVKLDGPFDREALVQLKAYIEQLLEMQQDNQDAAA